MGSGIRFISEVQEQARGTHLLTYFLALVDFAHWEAKVSLNTIFD